MWVVCQICTKTTLLLNLSFRQPTNYFLVIYKFTQVKEFQWKVSKVQDLKLFDVGYWWKEFFLQKVAKSHFQLVSEESHSEANSATNLSHSVTTQSNPLRNYQLRKNVSISSIKLASFLKYLKKSNQQYNYLLKNVSICSIH